jgi:hypothetical protein
LSFFCNLELRIIVEIILQRQHCQRRAGAVLQALICHLVLVLYEGLGLKNSSKGFEIESSQE